MYTREVLKVPRNKGCQKFSIGLVVGQLKVQAMGLQEFGLAQDIYWWGGTITWGSGLCQCVVDQVSP